MRLRRVKDIRPGSGGSDPYYFTNVAGTLFFTANDGNGYRMWTSDGTEAGTDLIDIVVGTGSSEPTAFTRAGDDLYFLADDGATGPALWKSDGTATGTVLVSDVQGFAYPTALNGTVLFANDDGTNGPELWRSDGTAAGTAIVKDFHPGPIGSYPSGLAHVSATVFFAGDDGTSGVELWKTDGTAAGTVLVKDIAPGAVASYPTNFAPVGTTLFFAASDDTHGEELWKSDGTAAGTVLVKDINPGPSSSIIEYVANVMGELFFTADLGSGLQLWKSDGTEAGTLLVRGAGNPAWLTAVNHLLFFVEGTGLWKSDGTSAGTVLVKDGLDLFAPPYFTVVNGTLFFRAGDATNGYELWKSDGTASGTVMVRDIRPGEASSNPQALTRVNGWLYFKANDGVSGYELWRSDGTMDGTVQVADMWPGTRGEDEEGIGYFTPVGPSELTAIGNDLFFVGDSPGFGLEPWVLRGAGACEIGAAAPCAGGCSATPRVCSAAAKSVLRLSQAADEASDRLLWRWTRGESVAAQSFGDPTSTATYSLCVYSGTESQLTAFVEVPADGTLWRETSRGYRYVNPTAAGSGVTAILLSGSSNNTSKTKVAGRGTLLPNPPLPLATPVTVQLINTETELCVGSTFASGDVTRAATNIFKAVVR